MTRLDQEELTMTRVRVVEYPRVRTTVGKNELNPQAAMCRVWNKTKRASLGSVRACLNPAIAPRLSCNPTVSRSILACARSRCSGVSQRVVRGWSGSKKMAAMATATVTIPICQSPLLTMIREILPRMMNSHLQPSSPWAPPIEANVAAAIRPLKEVARILAEYKTPIRRAISLRV